MRYECLPEAIREENDRLAEQYFNQTEIESWDEFEKIRKQKIQRVLQKTNSQTR